MENGKVTLDDVNPMSWADFGNALDSPLSKIVSYCKSTNTQFDIVAPILRSGGVTGSAIAINLGITAFLPIQFKHMPGSREPRQMLSVPDILQDPPASPNILVCETNTDRGIMAVNAIELIQSQYSTAKVFYATLAKVYGGSKDLTGAVESFFGVETNERSVLSEADCEAKGVRPGICIFPWENAEDEISQINGEV